MQHQHDQAQQPNRALQLTDFVHMSCSLGKVDARSGYHTASSLYPVGLTTRLRDANGAVFESRIADGGESGASFIVSLVQPPEIASAPAQVWCCGRQVHG